MTALSLILAVSLLAPSETPAAVPSGGTNTATPAAGLPAVEPAGQWFALGAPYTGYHGFGTLDAAGNVLVRWHCKTGTTDVRPGLPTLAPAYAPPTPATYPAFFTPYYPAASPCASGRCPR